MEFLTGEILIGEETISDNTEWLDINIVFELLWTLRKYNLYEVAFSLRIQRSFTQIFDNGFH